MACVTRWRCPAPPAGGTSVRSSRSVSSWSRRAACSSSARFAASAASSASRTRLIAPPTSRRPSWSRPPSLLLKDDRGDFLPSSSWSSARSSSRVDAAAMRGAASASMASISERIEGECSPLRRAPRQSVRWAAAVRRCRSASKHSTEPAMATLSDSERPAIGMVICWSTRARTSAGRPWASLPSTTATGPLQIDLVVGQAVTDHRGHAPNARGSQRGEHVDRVTPAGDGHVEERARRGAHALRVAGVDRAPAEDHRGGAGGLGGPQEGARVARIGHVDEDQRDRSGGGRQDWRPERSPRPGGRSRPVRSA